MASSKFFLSYGLSLCTVIAASVPTAQFDNARSGGTSVETVLTPTTVQSSRFAQLGTYAVAGLIFAQPLYISGVTVGSAHNILIVATLANNLYALDADNPGASPLWTRNFGAVWASPPGNADYYNAGLGILSTPVIDEANGWIFCVSVNNTPTYTLHKVAIATGSVISSVDITGSVVGTGAGTVGGVTDNTSGSNLLFTAAFENQRPGLLLVGGNIYIAFAAIVSELTVWHGWIFAYDESLTQRGVYCTSPNGNGAGIWQSSGGLSSDGTSVFAATGNGSWDGITSFGQSILKLDASLNLTDWFTPANHVSTNAADADISSGRPIFIASHFMTLGSKDGRVWVLDTNSMGHLQGTSTAPQVFTVVSLTPGAFTGVYGGLFVNNVGYFPIQGGHTYAYSFSSGTFNTTPIAISTPNYAQMFFAESTNGGSTGVMWVTTIDASAFSTKQPVTLRAWNPVTLTELWNSGAIGNYSKFNTPTIASGRIYVPIVDGSVVVFGLTNPVALTGLASISGAASLK